MNVRSSGSARTRASGTAARSTRAAFTRWAAAATRSRVALGRVRRADRDRNEREAEARLLPHPGKAGPGTGRDLRADPAAGIDLKARDDAGTVLYTAAL